MRTFTKDNLITDWSETVGLRVICVDSFEMPEYDDAPTVTVITFDNGKVAVQWDQASWGTYAGLIDITKADRYRSRIENAMAKDAADEIEIGKQYQFYQLESYLNEWENNNKALVVTHKIPGITPAGTGFDGTAIMHTFGGNFCGDWQIGDGVLFYNDGDVHSAEPHQEFTVVQIIAF